jgi:hypothetical protein
MIQNTHGLVSQRCYAKLQLIHKPNLRLGLCALVYFLELLSWGSPAHGSYQFLRVPRSTCILRISRRDFLNVLVGGKQSLPHSLGCMPRVLFYGCMRKLGKGPFRGCRKQIFLFSESHGVPYELGDA